MLHASIQVFVTEFAPATRSSAVAFHTFSFFIGGGSSLAKDQEKKSAVGASLYAGLEALRIVAYLLYPYMPNTSARIAEQLGVEPPESARWSDVARWGVFAPGHAVRTGPALFPRLERTMTP